MMAPAVSGWPRPKGDNLRINESMIYVKFLLFLGGRSQLELSLATQNLQARLHQNLVKGLPSGPVEDCASNAGWLGSIPGQGTRSHRPQLRVCKPQLKILCAATKTWCSQINKY